MWSLREGGGRGSYKRGVAGQVKLNPYKKRDRKSLSHAEVDWGQNKLSGSFNMGAYRFIHAEGGLKKFCPVLGGGGAKSFPTAIFPFYIPLHVINDR